MSSNELFWNNLEDGKKVENMIIPRLTNGHCWRHPVYAGDEYQLNQGMMVPKYFCKGQRIKNVGDDRGSDLQVHFDDCNGCPWNTPSTPPAMQMHEVKAVFTAHTDKPKTTHYTQNIFIECIENCRKWDNAKDGEKNENGDKPGTGWYWEKDQPDWYHFVVPFEFTSETHGTFGKRYRATKEEIQQWRDDPSIPDDARLIKALFPDYIISITSKYLHHVVDGGLKKIYIDEKGNRKNYWFLNKQKNENGIEIKGYMIPIFKLLPSMKYPLGSEKISADGAEKREKDGGNFYIAGEYYNPDKIRILPMWEFEYKDDWEYDDSNPSFGKCYAPANIYDRIVDTSMDAIKMKIEPTRTVTSQFRQMIEAPNFLYHTLANKVSRYPEYEKKNGVYKRDKNED